MLAIGSYSKLYRLFFVFQMLGNSFWTLSDFVSIVRRFVGGCKDEEDRTQTKHLNQQFQTETENILFLHPDVQNSFTKSFQEFSDFSVDSEHPLGVILASNREHCRQCKGKLRIHGKDHAIVVYDSELGSYLGSRITKVCSKCKIYEHYGYCTKDGHKYVSDDVLEKPFLLSSEETAFHVSLLKQMNSLLIVGAVPFSTFAASYNRRFGYNGDDKAREQDCPENTAKRMKRSTNEELRKLLQQRRKMDRRRLEEAFLLYASLECIHKHDLKVEEIPSNRETLTEMICEPFYESFVKTWGDHTCNVPGCAEVVVLDGNMKNARQVCKCKEVGELTFTGLHGSIVTGCQNTPAKGSRYCLEHDGLSSPFVDDLGDSKKCASNESIMIVKILNTKATRNEDFVEVMWSDGRSSWIKKRNLPAKIQKLAELGSPFEQQMVNVKELGQQRKELRIVNEKDFSLANNGKYQKRHIIASSGFGIEEEDDNMITNSDGSKKKIACGTEKGKHKSKNHRTAGILVVEKPCSIVVDVKELFGSESKSQVYAHVHNLLEKETLKETSVICYDDACHLKKFGQNPTGSSASDTAKRVASMSIVCDKFHFKNHVDSWCQKNCNPYDCKALEAVNSEVCEQLFSWLSRFSPITKHMSRWRFLFLMLYVLDCHNEDVLANS